MEGHAVSEVDDRSWDEYDGYYHGDDSDEPDNDELQIGPPELLIARLYRGETLLAQQVVHPIAASSGQSLTIQLTWTITAT